MGYVNGDEDVAEELALYIINDRRLYDERRRPLEITYAKKVLKGTFDRKAALTRKRFTWFGRAPRFLKPRTTTASLPPAACPSPRRRPLARQCTSSAHRSVASTARRAASANQRTAPP